MFINPYERELEVVRIALTEAVQLCRSVQDRVPITKSDRSPVTIADYGSQALICRALQEAFPNDPIMAEEDSALLRADEQAQLREILGEHLETIRPGTTLVQAMRWIDCGNAEAYSDRFWTLDPIDGTKGFLRNGHYAVALALIIDGEVAVAGLACPKLTDEIFLASRGYGASLGTSPLQVSQQSNVSMATISQSVESGHSALGQVQRVADYLRITSDRLRLDSQAKYAVVARGDAEIYMRLPIREDYIERIWDHAAGALILTEAGGIVTDVLGNPLDFGCGKGLEHNRGIIATNGKVHDAVMDALQTLEIAGKDVANCGR